jgi:hypothetical protein
VFERLRAAPTHPNLKGFWQIAGEDVEVIVDGGGVSYRFGVRWCAKGLCSLTPESRQKGVKNHQKLMQGRLCKGA